MGSIKEVESREFETDFSNCFGIFKNFWERHPALFYGLFALIGAYAAFFSSFWFLVPLTALFISAKNRRLIGCIVFAAAFLYIDSLYLFPDVPTQGISGTLLFAPSSITTSQSPFGTQWCYQGKGKQFFPDVGKLQGHDFPCFLRFSKKKEVPRPPAHSSYLIHGTLKLISHGKYVLLPDNNTPWLPLKGSWNGSEIRYHAKQTFKRYISKQFKDARTAEFLSGILTGEFEDRIMRQEFNRAGLLHIMAISGFHFSILSAALLIILRWFLQPKGAIALLIVVLSAYFLFLGFSASILRAWIMTVTALFAFLFEKSPFSLNSLGLAILCILIFDPLLSLSLGYAFSFAVTASILFFYSPAKEGLNLILPKRAYKNMREMSFLDQVSFLIVSLFKESTALCVAVNIMALPMTFLFFQKFPLLSLFYNLMIPFLVSVVMVLFLMGLLCPWIHGINGWLTHFMLNLIYNLPAPLHVTWHFHVKPYWVVLYLSALLAGGILIWNRKKQTFPS